MKGSIKALLIALVIGLIFWGFGAPRGASAEILTKSRQQSDTPEADNPYFSRTIIVLGDGTRLEKDVISGPPVPPAGSERERALAPRPVPGQANGIKLLTVPAYNWVFGCSAVSGAMIAGYYGRNGYPNMYTGPTAGGVMPLDSSTWPTWSDGTDIYPNNPLIASHAGVDGRTLLGSIDDYWVEYLSTARDPYLTDHRSQHIWSDAIGDYMKTSQYAYENVDGSTWFYNRPTSGQLTCDEMVSAGISTLDGTYGRKLFYEARGYTVTDCYNQKTDNNGGGFTFAMFKAQIDAGYPVLLNLEGHSVVGVGYDETGSTVTLHDTWDNSNHIMTWGTSYSGMSLLSVSIVNLAPRLSEAFEKTVPADTTTVNITNPTLSWDPSSGATSYDYCVATSAGGTDCPTGWKNVNENTSAAPGGLTDGTTYYWQVKATNLSGAALANGGTWWSFTVSLPTAVLVSDFRAGLAQPQGLWLEWVSETEVNTVGFNLYRAETPSEDFVRVNSALVPAKTPGQMFGNSYTYLDTSAKPGLHYLYKLICLDQNQGAQECSQVTGEYFMVQLPVVLQIGANLSR